MALADLVDTGPAADEYGIVSRCHTCAFLSS